MNNTPTPTPRTDEWETYCDECYYHMWRVRRKNERGFNDGFHLNNGEGARQLVELLNKQDSELTAARELVKNLEITVLSLMMENKTVTEQRDRLADLARQFIYILDITEESDGGRLFHPTNITSCRAGDLQKAGELVEALRRASRNQPMNDTPTPETERKYKLAIYELPYDTNYRANYQVWKTVKILKGHMERFERELAAVTEQRDEALSDLQFRRDLYSLQTKQLDNAREQRDRLAKALWNMLNQEHGSAVKAGILLRSLNLQYLNPNTPNQERKSPASDGSI